MDFNRLPKDVISEIALDLDLPDLLNYCKSYDRVNEATCSNKIFWINKFKKDFNIEYKGNDVRRRYEEFFNYVRQIIDIIYGNMAPAIGLLVDKDTLKKSLYDVLKQFGIYYNKKVDSKIKEKFTYIIAQYANGNIDLFDNMYHILKTQNNSFSRPVFIREALRQFLWNANYGPNDAEIKAIIRPFLEQGYISRAIITMLFGKYAKLNYYIGPDGKKYIILDPVAREQLGPYIPQTGIDPDKFYFSGLQKLIRPVVLKTQELSPDQQAFIRDTAIAEQLKNARNDISKL